MQQKRSLKTLTRVLWIVALGLVLGFWFYDSTYFYSFRDVRGERHDFATPDRTIGALIVVDSTIVDRYPNGRWREKTSTLLYHASEVFEKQTGIKIVTCGFLEFPRQLSLNLTFLERHISDCDIKVGITAVHLYNDTGMLGEDEIVAGKTAYDDFTDSPLDAVIISTQGSSSHRYVLAHEIGHLFRAGHTSKKGLLMSRAHMSGPKIDDRNWRVIVRNKYRDFKKDVVFRKLYFQFSRFTRWIRSFGS